jgi:hypothetical protein
MTKLSPAAQATYDAFNRVGLYNEPTFETDRKALAAALRAAADQFFYDWNGMCCEEHLKSIANELEAQ